MKWLKAVFAAVVLAAAFISVTPSPASAQAATLIGGEWRGMYWGAGNQPTEFQVTLRVQGGALSGTTVELNGFGNQDSPFLLGNITGTLRNGQVTFVKAYDGTAGVSHNVNYTGALQPNGRRIVGTWSAEGATGRFEMVR